MSTYYGTTRTNYFRVTNEELYKKLISYLYVSDGGPVTDFSKEIDGVLYHGFGAYGSIDFRAPIDKEETAFHDFDFFVETLCSILPEGEAFILTEVGNEKLCYVSGYSVVATKDGTEIVNLCNDAINKAREMLNNPDFTTKMDY